MKKVFYVIAMFLVASCNSGQEKGKEQEQEKGSIIFKGTVIPNGKDKEVEVLVRGKTVLAIPVKEDSTFYGELPLDKMKQLAVRHGVCSQPIFAKPGREITINFGSEAKTAKFTGSPETQYYIDMRFLLYPGDMSIIYDMPWHVYKKYMQDAVASRMRLSELYCMAYDISPSYRKEVESFAIYSSYRSLVSWPKFHMNKNKLTEFKEEADWKAHIESLYAEIEWDDPFLCGVPHYVGFAEMYLNEEIKKNEKNGSFLLDAYEVIKTKISNEKVKEFFMLHYTKKYLKDAVEGNQKLALEAFKKDVSNPKYIAKLDGILESAKRFGNNAQAFDFTIENSDGKMVTLSSLKGKVVYIDFWATWCAPCRGEIPHMNKLKGELKANKDIEIICVSTDQVRDKEKWKQMLKDKGMTGYQLFAGDKASDIKKYYNVRGIPHFTMIGKDGKIFKNATIRPSNPQTKSVLINLAKEK